MAQPKLLQIILLTLMLAVPANAHPCPPVLPLADALKIKLFLIAVDDGGRSGKKIGCNDSVIPFVREIPPTRAPLQATLAELLKLSERPGSTEGLYNALQASKLRVERVSVHRGEARVELAGVLMTGGVCDSPRVQAQIEETALQFPTVRQVSTYINGVRLAEYLSGRK